MDPNSSQIETEVVNDNDALGETKAQMQETHEQHTPDVARGQGRNPCLPAAEIPALWRFIGLHIRLHLRVDVHAGSGSWHGEKNSKKKTKNSHTAARGSDHGVQ